MNIKGRLREILSQRIYEDKYVKLIDKDRYMVDNIVDSIFLSLKTPTPEMVEKACLFYRQDFRIIEEEHRDFLRLCGSQWWGALIKAAEKGK